MTKTAFVAAGGQLAAWLRVRYPNIIAGAISSSSTVLGAPGLGLVSPICTLLCLSSHALHMATGCLLSWHLCLQATAGSHVSHATLTM